MVIVTASLFDDGRLEIEILIDSALIYSIGALFATKRTPSETLLADRGTSHVIVRSVPAGWRSSLKRAIQSEPEC